MSRDNMQQDIGPFFLETQEKIRDNDTGTKDSWGSMKQARYDHVNHKSNGPQTVRSLPQCQGGARKCEIH